MDRKKSNENLTELVIKLENTKKPAWQNVAAKLEKPTRQRAQVNLWKINKYSKDGETIVIPGKVLSEGELDHKITLGAYSYSTKAVEKMKGKATCLSIDALLEKNPTGAKMRILE